ncbi:hypothetical protein BDV09DRAFT_198914 [Aspergillus tetrazonus]
MDCFRQLYRFIKAPFIRQQHRIFEIGPPTDFRKEELPSCFTDDDAITLHSRTALDKEAIVKAAEEEPSKRDKIRTHVRRLSVKMSRPQQLIETE